MYGQVAFPTLHAVDENNDVRWCLVVLCETTDTMINVCIRNLLNT